MLIAVSNGIRGHPPLEFQVGVTQQPLRQAFSKIPQGVLASGALIWRSYNTEAMQHPWSERIVYLESAEATQRNCAGWHQSLWCQSGTLVSGNRGAAALRGLSRGPGRSEAVERDWAGDQGPPPIKNLHTCYSAAVEATIFEGTPRGKMGSDAFIWGNGDAET